MFLKYNIDEYYFQLDSTDCLAPMYPEGQTFGHLELRHHDGYSSLSTTIDTDFALCELICFVDIFFATKMEQDPFDCLPYEKLVCQNKHYETMSYALVGAIVEDRSVLLYWGSAKHQANYQYELIPATYEEYLGFD